ncbi:hypothetical protein GCM10010195_29810 [Kitasatospora griseola]|nr:hypothetical protein GCM10010195_29810 [Kitasatospora griseola]
MHRLRTMSPPQLRRAGRLLAALTPLTLAGLSALAVDPDFTTPADAAALLVLAAALLTLVVMRAGRRSVVLGALCGTVLLAVPGAAFADELLRRRGVDTEVVITAAHRTTSLFGGSDWTCDLRRTDGRPLPHAALSGSLCPGPEQIGRTATVTVDPTGWTPPTSADPGRWDRTDLAPAVALLVATTALWSWLALSPTRSPTRTRLTGRSTFGAR